MNIMHETLHTVPECTETNSTTLWLLSRCVGTEHNTASLHYTQTYTPIRTSIAFWGIVAKWPCGESLCVERKLVG